MLTKKESGKGKDRNRRGVKEKRLTRLYSQEKKRVGRKVQELGKVGKW